MSVASGSIRRVKVAHREWRNCDRRRGSCTSQQTRDIEPMHWFNVSCLLGAVSLYLMVIARPLSDAVIVMGLLCQRRLFHVQTQVDVAG